MTIRITRRALSLALAPPLQSATVAPSFPAHPTELAREVVGVSHFDLEKLKMLVDPQPALARAAVDWGFGDWEDALGAASHVGRRDIAEYLIAKGARPSLFSAAMLGQLEVVKAAVAAQPGVQRIEGPHSISLLAHARAGGKQAEPVLRFLEALGDAGSPAQTKLDDQTAASWMGTYVFGTGATDKLEVAQKNGMIMLTRPGQAGRRLVYVGDGAFHPAGASQVRIRFAGASEEATMTIHDPGLILTARRRQ